MENLKKLLSEYDAVIFFDTETTGLDAESKDELGQQIQVIELAAKRLELDKNQNVIVTSEMDDFIKLPEGNVIPPTIIKFNEIHGTGINDNFLKENGMSETDACKKFETLAKGNVIFVAYNAQFDLCMVREMLNRSGSDKMLIDRNDVLDPLTIFKAIKTYLVDEEVCKTKYPNIDSSKLNGHKLETALLYFNVADKFKNSHRAIDDCEALIEITKQLYKTTDVSKWVNTIGYNPKYGLNGKKHPKTIYFEQEYLKNVQKTHSETIDKTDEEIEK